MRAILTLLLAACALLGGAAAAAPEFQEVLATRAQLRALQQGGYVLYLRHGLTDNDHTDRLPSVDLADCSTQRQLSEGGRQMALQIGRAMREARIVLNEIHASPLCRAYQTAALAFPAQRVTLDAQLMYTANLTDAEKAPILARTRSLLGQPVGPGGNRLLAAHGPNLMDLISYFPKEGTLVIFLPGPNGSFRYVASIPPGHWATLLP